MDQINSINEKILQLSQQKATSADDKSDKPPPIAPTDNNDEQRSPQPVTEVTSTHQGKLIVDATACPQDISYPTDLNLLSDGREKLEGLLDFLYDPAIHHKKPRTYREVARKLYLKVAQKKVKTKKEIRRSIKQQLGFVKRDIKNIHVLLSYYETIPFDAAQYKYFLVIQTLYDQQLEMYKEKRHSVDHRIVSIHQPHVRPIVRGKTNAGVEFGAKIQVSMMNGFAFLEHLSWEAFNEGTRLLETIEHFKSRTGRYPKEVLVDKIYCNRTNRAKLKELGIALIAKPLGRPKAMSIHIRPGQRNPIEGKFGQAKTAYGMDRIKARLQQTSESWIATIILVLNLVKLTGQVPYCNISRVLTFSAYRTGKLIGPFNRSSYPYQNLEILKIA